MPFDFLLASIAEAYAGRVAAVVLSGTGADGSVGLSAIRANGGVTFAQLPSEAGQAGMPENAIATGLVDHVLPVAGIAAELLRFAQPGYISRAEAPEAIKPQSAPPPPWLSEVTALLRVVRGLDFTSYKAGTLVRRTLRRANMAGFPDQDIAKYLELLRHNSDELGLLANDMLINVTGFFRDAWVFEYLSEKLVPGLVADHPEGQPLRIWSAACSTGEESYSIAMLFLDEIKRNRPGLRLQLFATDVDADALALARDGFYPSTIADVVGQERLHRYFAADDNGWRISSELRGSIVFAVQDLLGDPPFSQIDLIFCRNMLMYLDAVAQEKVIATFHFALRPQALLLLGSAETAGAIQGRFELVSKQARLYRRVGDQRPLRQRFFAPTPSFSRLSKTPGRTAASEDPAKLCHELLMNRHAPPTVLIDDKFICLVLSGNTDRYLRVAPSFELRGLLPMLPQTQRGPLRAAVARAARSDGPITTMSRDGHDGQPFSMSVEKAICNSETVFLVSFHDAITAAAGEPLPLNDVALTLERQLEALRAELDEALAHIENADFEERASRADTLSINEEYHTANEELLTSQEELQSLNEELTALNGQLQETLDRQRTTADDLQNVLYSTDVATIFLDTDLRIRFFTPATRRLFRMLPTDIGRPMSDLAPAVVDATLNTDAQRVLSDGIAIEREIAGAAGDWFVRRILPYRTHLDRIEGVVITVVDITERKNAARVLVEARLQADAANLAKSRFLAAASHDLRQPLQTLVLLQEVLMQKTESEDVQVLLDRLARTLTSMTSMLNTLLDINQIESGSVLADVQPFPVATLLDRIGQEFGIHADAYDQNLRIVPNSAIILSDPFLLSQIVHNLVANSLKYTRRGTALVGCRRRGRLLDIEVWDNGVGIPPSELDAVFDAYHQVGAADRDRNRGLGLGLSIVRRLSDLLEHKVSVESVPGKGSMFRISVPLATSAVPAPQADVAQPDTSAPHVGVDILLIDDDTDLLDLVGLLLASAGHRIATAMDEAGAFKVLQETMPKPAIIITDLNLAGKEDGLHLVAKIRERVGSELPVIVLTGDISVEALARIPEQGCFRVAKPVRMQEMLQVIDRLVAQHNSAQVADEIVYIVDDDPTVLAELTALLRSDGFVTRGFESSEALLEGWTPHSAGCLLIDATLPGLGGLELIRRLRDDELLPPCIIITGHGNIRLAVDAMKIGALDFIQKPASGALVLESVRKACLLGRNRRAELTERHNAAALIGSLTTRQRQVMQMIVNGHPSKNIAADLRISPRTVEKYRAEVMRKTGMRSLPALARLVLAAAL
ncbi:protein-glutamate methylesterase [Polymorphobacter multimanifer]|nr:protein-glutamate methylesterase [Polymorphobacter multimanifer]